MTRFREWLSRKWSRQLDAGLTESYRVVFSGLHGERVLEHLITSVYATVYEGKDSLELAAHNGRRSVVQEILEVIDRAEHPQRYEITTEGVTHG